MALATLTDVENALGRELADGEDVSTLIEEASDLVISYLGHDVSDTAVPGPIARAVATMVAAVITKPAVTTADYAATGYNTAREQTAIRVGIESATTTGPWLTASLKMRLRPYRTAAFSVQLGSEVAP